MVLGSTVVDFEKASFRCIPTVYYATIKYFQHKFK